MASAEKAPRLLIVEDNSDTRLIYKDVFEREGFHVLVAEDGEKGLSYAQATLPDVILLDQMLPKLNGMDLLSRLRDQKETESIPVMIFSARDVTDEVKKNLRRGVTEYSAKAMNSPKEMVRRVRALMNQPAAGDRATSGAARLHVAIKDFIADAPRLQATLGSVEGFRCPDCKGHVLLELLPDPTRVEGHWFAARFICSSCAHTF